VVQVGRRGQRIRSELPSQHPSGAMVSRRMMWLSCRRKETWLRREGGGSHGLQAEAGI